MELFEKTDERAYLFSENVRYSWKTAGQSDSFVLFETGLLERYGIEAMVYELNANWIKALIKCPLRKTG